jgi:hypothetical protein
MKWVQLIDLQCNNRIIVHGMENVNFIFMKTAGCIFYPEKDEGSTFYQNVATHLPNYMMSQPRRPQVDEDLPALTHIFRCET